MLLSLFFVFTLFYSAYHGTFLPWIVPLFFFSGLILSTLHLLSHLSSLWQYRTKTFLKKSWNYPTAFSFHLLTLTSLGLFCAWKYWLFISVPIFIGHSSVYIASVSFCVYGFGSKCDCSTRSIRSREHNSKEHMKMITEILCDPLVLKTKLWFYRDTAIKPDSKCGSTRPSNSAACEQTLKCTRTEED